MDLHDVLRILRERWLVIAGVASATVAVAAGFAVLQTPMYQATTQLFVSMSVTDNSLDAYQGALFSQQRVKSYAKLMGSEEMSRRIIAKLGSSDDPEDLMKRIQTAVDPDTVILSVSVTDPRPQHARDLARAAGEVLVKYVAELEQAPDGKAALVHTSIADPPRLPKAPVSPDVPRNIAVALALGLLGGLGVGALRDALDVRVKTAEALAEASGNAALLGNIHYTRSAVKEPLISALGRHAPRVEAFRVLRTNLQFVSVDKSNKVFVITSALPEEGKTTTACNVSIALAEAGARVLLLEGDLRRPKVAEYFGIESAVGVSTVLVGRASLRDAVQVANGVSILASGRRPPNASELLQSGAMRRLLAEAREMFDYVIIDAPPLLPVTDAALLAAEADGAVLVVRHGRTTTHDVRTARARLEAVGAELLGTIVNMTPEVKRTGRYGYGYGYGYQYGYGPTTNDDSRNPDLPRIGTAIASSRRDAKKR